MRLTLPSLALIGLLSMSGCVSTNANRSLDCPGWVRPITTEEADQLTDATAREIVSHNETFDTLCGSPEKSPAVDYPPPSES